MSGSSGMHGGGGGINGIKLESGPVGHLGGGAGAAGNYYCNSYTPPAPVDHGLLSSAAAAAAYSKWSAN